jgi:hypothetical protein
MQLVRIPRHKPRKKVLQRRAAVKAAIARYCPGCSTPLIRTRRPNEEAWRMTCSSFCGFEAA